MRNRKSPLDYYRTLGLEPGASKKELRKAYLRLVRDCHPDRFARNPQAQFLAQEKLKEINEAYCVPARLQARRRLRSMVISRRLNGAMA